MPSLWKILALASAFTMFSGLLAGGEDPSERITVAGSPAVRPIVEEAAKEFARTHPEVSIDFRADEATDGLQAVAAGEVAIGMVAREIEERERARWSDLTLTVVGVEAIAIAVHPANPVYRITMSQLAKVYAGRISNWSELGGRDAPIVRISRPAEQPACRWFLDCCGLTPDDRVPARTNVLALRGPDRLRSVEVPVRTRASNREILAAAAEDPNAIAYVSLNAVQETAALEGKVKLLELDNVIATVENAAEAGYPFQRPLCVATNGTPTEAARAFVEFLTSEAGQRIVERLEYIPVRPPTPQ